MHSSIIELAAVLVTARWWCDGGDILLQLLSLFE